MVDGYGKLSDEQIKLSTEVTPVNDPLRTSFHSIVLSDTTKNRTKNLKNQTSTQLGGDIDSDSMEFIITV